MKKLFDEAFKRECREIEKQFPDCDHPTKTLVWIKVGTDAISKQLREQCVNCGKPTGPVLSHTHATHDTPWGDTSKYEARMAERQRLMSEAWDRLEKRYEQKDDEWWRRYTAYLESAEWHTKRRLVFKRCSGMCEGCGMRPAAEVHHLTYEHVFNEFLWELTAVCVPCHERAHRRDVDDEAA